MISKKVFSANGTNTRFLSDFIIRSEQFARPYVYIYDNTLASDGSEDQLVSGSTSQSDWSWPSNIWKRGADVPQAGDIVTEDKWQIVDNSALFYLPPIATSTVWLEVATTSEEFGDSLIDAQVEDAQLAAVASQVKAWEAEAEALTADSYATQTEDVFVNTYTSDGDGTFTATPTTEYSALHWAAKADASATAADTESGTYTPTVISATNTLSALTDGATKYQRIGNIVNVIGTLAVTPDSGSSISSIVISLPILPSSNFTSTTDISGIATAIDHYGDTLTEASSGSVIAEVGAKNTRVYFTTLTAGDEKQVSFSFSYILA